MIKKYVLMFGVGIIAIILIMTAVIIFMNKSHDASGTGKPPKNWFQAGLNIKDYEVGIDKQVTRDGKNCAYIKSVVPAPREFTTLMQQIKADDYRGKRVRMSVFVKSEDVQGWAGFWMRVDGPNNECLGFDNMQERPIKETSDWKKHEVVLDVPENSKGIAFGVLMEGAGRVWISGIKIEIVDKDVPETDMMNNSTQPQNLDFKE